MNKIIVQKDQARLYGRPYPIPQGQSQFSEIEFSFSEEWANLRKIAQFEQKSGPYNVDISDNKCFCPSELVKGWVNIRVKGYPEDTTSAVIATANEIILPVSMGFKPGGTPSVPPTPDLYQKLIGEFSNKVQSDWAQNDPTAKDYVKNRTHYRSIDKATVTVKAGKEGILSDMVPFEPGDVVGITVNGEEMSMTAASDTISVAGQSQEFVYVGDSPSGIISGTVKYGWCVYSIIDIGLYTAITLKADCTIEYSAYVYTRLPMEYSPITLETDVRTESGAARNEYIKISNVIIDDSISYSDYPIAVTRTDDTGQTELVITGKHNSYSPVMNEVGINLICELLLNQNVFSWVMDPDKNLKEFFDENSDGLVQFSDVKIDGVLYKPFLQICSRGLYGTLAALTGSVYAVTVDFGSTVKAEWFDNKWKIVIKKIG